MALILLLCSMTACGKKSPEPEEVLTAEQQEDNIPVGDVTEQEASEEINEQDAAAAVSEEEAAKEESENMEETLKSYTYRGDTVLTKDNFRETIETYLFIRSPLGLRKLEDLPLTESFFDESIMNFPYIKTIRTDLDLNKVEDFHILFWGVGEKPNEMVCMCEFSWFKYPGHNKRDCYYIVLEIENDQINSMERTLVEQYNLEY